MSTEQMSDEPSQGKANCLRKPLEEAFDLSVSRVSLSVSDLFYLFKSSGYRGETLHHPSCYVVQQITLYGSAAS